MPLSRFVFYAFSIGTILTLRAEPPSLSWSHERGLIDGAFELTLTAEPETAQIVYTLDGSPPTNDSANTYTAPLTIDTSTVVRAMATDEEGESTIETHTFIFPDQVTDQEAFPQGFPTQIISRRNGPGRPHTFDWAMDPEVLNDKENNGDLAAHLRDLPTLSIVMDLKDLNFVFDNQTQRGVDFERPASFELFYPNTERYEDFEGCQIDCGLRIQGGGAGDQARKKSFRLLFKKIYGKGSLDYPLFESAVHYGGNAASSFEGVVLRAGGNTNWSKDDAWKHGPSTYLRDPLVRDSQIAISGIGSRSVFTHLYLNGFYFGLYNIAERPDEKFAASYLGGDIEDHYAINHGGTVGGDSGYWNDILSSSNLRNLGDPDRYAAITDTIAIESYCDYILLNWLVGMGDWPHNNFYGGVRNDPPGKIRFYSWDSEYAFWTLEGYLGSNPTAWIHPSFESSRNQIPEIWLALAENPEFLNTFADRVNRHCFHDGALSDANLQARLMRLSDEIENAIVAESARWGDSSWGREDDPHTRANDFIPNRDDILSLIEGNADRFVEVLRDRGYYPELDAPELISSGLAGSDSHQITMKNPNETGALYYTIDGTDPRLPGGNVSPNAIRYEEDSPLIVNEATRVKARVIKTSLFGDATASPLTESLYLTAPLGYPLRITEIMYHPVESEALEFIELQNVSAARLDLTGVYFDGIDYRFAPGTWMEPQQIIVLIPNDDPEAFGEVYPDVDVFDTYRRHLGNDGERIQILNADDNVLTEIFYDDDLEATWPELADGQGHSLEAVDPLIAAQEREQWRISSDPGGTPGVVTAPQDHTTDVPKLAIRLTNANQVTLTFGAEPNREYVLETRSTSADASWQTLTTILAKPSARQESISQTIDGKRLFRLGVKN